MGKEGKGGVKKGVRKPGGQCRLRENKPGPLIANTEALTKISSINRKLLTGCLIDALDSTSRWLPHPFPFLLLSLTSQPDLSA